MSLGRGAWRAFIADRGGPTDRAVGGKTARGYLGEISHSGLTCGRALDATSGARLAFTPSTLARRSADGDMLNTIAPWEHELHLWRDRELAWLGPLKTITFKDEVIQLEAVDLSGWMERRNVGDLIEVVDEDYATIFERLVEEGLRRDDSPNINLSVTPSLRRGDRVYDPDERPRIADELNNLARSGVDWTVIGRTWIIGGDNLPVPALGICPNEFFRDIEIGMPGDAQASEVTVIGFDDGQGAPIGTASTGRLPLLEQVFQDDSVVDDGAALSSAQARLAFLSQKPIYPRMEFADAPLKIADLIPGALADLRISAGGRTCFGAFRLVGVQFDVSPDGAEKISPSFVPGDDVEV